MFNLGGLLEDNLIEQFIILEQINEVECRAVKSDIIKYHASTFLQNTTLIKVRILTVFFVVQVLFNLNWRWMIDE